MHAGEGLANAIARSKNVDPFRISTFYFDLVRRYFATTGLN